MFVAIFQESFTLLRQRWLRMALVGLLCLPFVSASMLATGYVTGRLAVSAAKTAASTSVVTTGKPMSTGSDPVGGSQADPAVTAAQDSAHVSHNPATLLTALGLKAIIVIVLMMVMLTLFSITQAAMLRAVRIDEPPTASVGQALVRLPRSSSQQGVIQVGGLFAMIVFSVFGKVLGAPGVFLGVAGQLALFGVLTPLTMLAVADCALYDRDWWPLRSAVALLRQPRTTAAIAGVLVATWVVIGALSIVVIGLLLLPVAALWMATLSAAMLEYLGDDAPEDALEEQGDLHELGADDGALQQPAPAAWGADPMAGAVAVDPGAQQAAWQQQQQAHQHQPVQQQPLAHTLLNGMTDPSGAPSGGWIQVGAPGQVTLCLAPAESGLSVHVADEAGAWQGQVPAVDGAGTTSFPLQPGMWWVNVSAPAGTQVGWRIDAWLPPGAVQPYAA